MIQSCIKVCLVLCQICDTRHVDRNNANRSGTFTWAKETTGFLAEFSQVQTQPTAHRTHIARLHVTVDIIWKIWCAVFCGHFKEQSVVLGIRPVKISGNRISRDRILESTTIGIALDHDLKECTVDHIHFLLAVLVLKVHFLAADDSR